ncbi:MAG: cell division protein ZapA [Paludibacteraceae bacterium]|nr:cell division protein ZapA [Paludibacteraceae bacterium]
MAVRKITLWVANERIELNIDTEKERYFREAEEEIEKKLLAYQSQRKNMSIETAMRVALIDATVSKLMKIGKDSELEDNLDKLHSDLDDVLLKHS